MPRGNPYVWKQYGASYAQLSGTTTSIERAHELAPRRLPSVTPGMVAELKATKPAGIPAVAPHRGTGSFVLQPGWSLGVPCTAGAGTQHLPRQGQGRSHGAGALPSSGAGGLVAWSSSSVPPSPRGPPHVRPSGAASVCSGTNGTNGSTGAQAAAGAPAAAAAAVGSGPTAASSTAAAATGNSVSGNAVATTTPSTSTAVPATSRAAAAMMSSASTTSFSSTGLPPRSYATESKANYQPPAVDFRRVRSAGPRPSQFPVPNDPNDWRTCKQVEFRADLHRAEQAQPFRLHDHGRLLPSDVPPASQFATSQRSHFPGRSFRESQSVPTSGCRATQAAGYNIITGAPAFANNAFEHWDGRDYRRHR